MTRSTSSTLATIYTKEAAIGAVALAGIAVHLILRFTVGTTGSVLGFPSHEIPLLIALACGAPLVIGLVIHLSRLEFSADLLAGISIVTSVILGEYLAGTLVVLMLSGGQALEAYAVRRASFALEALARRLPAVAHRKKSGRVEDLPLANVAVGDALVVFPHETCPVDGVVMSSAIHRPRLGCTENHRGGD